MVRITHYDHIPMHRRGEPECPNDPDGTVPDMGAFYFAQDGIPNIETEVTLLEFSGVSLTALMP